jgi:hypothetical protein
MTKLTLAVLLLASAPAFAAAPAPTASASGLSPLAEKYARKREAMIQEYSARRRALLASPRWRASSPAERKAALDALAAEAKEKDDGLVADYDAELRQGRAATDSDAANVQKARQDRLDELRARAAQDAFRARPPR